MAIDQQELGRRLKQARQACWLTQEDVARQMMVARPTIAQIEAGNRSVSGLELGNLAYIYGRDIREFLNPSFSADSIAAVLLRAEEDTDPEVKTALRECIALGHQLRDLEDLLGIGRSTIGVAAYSSVSPSSKWEAIQSGMKAAIEERRRLGLGSAPLGDVPALLEEQGIRTGLISMPQGVSGLMISDPTVGLFVVVNRSHPAVRQRFSWCHEYAHVLLDRTQVTHVSRESERADLLEVRANVFAANFLMPEEGVRQFIGILGKGNMSRLHAEVFDESGVVAIDSRTSGGSQDLQLYDVVKLAHHFGVSVLSALYRLMNLRMITDKQFESMKQADVAGMSKQLAVLLGLREISEAENINAFYRRYLVLALEAYRREKISRRKLVEIAGKLGVNSADVEHVIEELGLAVEESDEVLLPAIR